MFWVYFWWVCCDRYRKPRTNRSLLSLKQTIPEHGLVVTPKMNQMQQLDAEFFFYLTESLSMPTKLPEWLKKTHLQRVIPQFVHSCLKVIHKQILCTKVQYLLPVLGADIQGEEVLLRQSSQSERQRLDGLGGSEGQQILLRSNKCPAVHLQSTVWHNRLSLGFLCLALPLSLSLSVSLALSLSTSLPLILCLS